MKQATEFTVHKGWRILLKDIGLQPSDILEAAKLPADLFSREGATLTAPQYFQLFDALEQTAGSQNIGLKVGQAISVEAFDPPIFASLCSPNLNTAFKRLAKYKRLIGPMLLHLEENEKN